MSKNIKENRCLNCAENRNCKDSIASWVFFIIGIIATVAIRVVTVLIHLDQIYAKIAWYIGVIGFFLFFTYKFRVSHIRAKLIRKSGLAEKINAKEVLRHEDYMLLSSIFCGLGSKKERINYFIIFALSAVALVLAIYMDFIR